MGGKQSKEAAIDFGQVIGTFACKYIGSVPVKASTGNDVCQNAVQRILALKGKEKAILLKVTSKGIYLIDAATNDIIKDVPIADVSFVGTSSEDSKLISFFEKDTKARLITCNTFRVLKEAFKIPLAVEEAFQRMREEKAEADGVKVSRRSSSNMSKKEALAASSATKNSRVDKGALLQKYDCKFLGTVNVSLPKGDDVAAEALGRVVKLDAIEKCELEVYENVAEIANRAAGDILYSCLVRDVSFAKTSDDKLTFSFIVNDRRLERIQFSALTLYTLEEDKPSIRRCLDQAIKALAEKARAEQERVQEEEMKRQLLEGGDLNKFVAQKSDEQETGKIIGTFEATYMGPVVVKETKGGDVVNEGAARLLKEKKKTAGDNIFLQVSTEGVKCVESLTHEILLAYVLKDISFSTVAGRSKELFAFIQKDDTLGINNCHVFHCAGERAFDIATAFGEAFKAFAEEVKKTGGNPFAPIGERVPPPDHLVSRQVHRVDLRPIKAIGAGQFGQVYLAEQVLADSSTRRAVKMLRGGASEADRNEFLREAQVMFDLQHPQLVNIIGVVIQQKPWLMVLEYLQYGDLRSVLKAALSKNISLTYWEQLNYAKGVSSGMEFIASQRLVHMDLACRNCLVGEGNVVKIADFGITRPLDEGKDYHRSPVVLKLPVKWCSIEALDDRLFSEASDVWAFGVVLWEIFSYGRMPYEQFKTQEIQRRVRDGLRLEQPPGCDDDLYDLMHSCWEVDRQKRPAFRALTITLGNAQSAETPSDRDVAAAVLAK
eukprot:m.241933 g.241933  ORF g.241933 m.241933 type:complete len:774 (-) comp13936_c0_seq1:86-2407(-)